MTRNPAPSDTTTCARCGITLTRGTNTPPLSACRDCRAADPYGTALILDQPPPPPPTRKRRVPQERDTWPDTDLRRAAAQHKAGARDDWTLTRLTEYRRRHSQRSDAAKGDVA
jgi:hypothetical protein